MKSKSEKKLIEVLIKLNKEFLRKAPIRISDTRNIATLFEYVKEWLRELRQKDLVTFATIHGPDEASFDWHGGILEITTVAGKITLSRVSDRGNGLSVILSGPNAWVMLKFKNTKWIESDKARVLDKMTFCSIIYDALFLGNDDKICD